jgi:hypothetical protein
MNEKHITVRAPEEQRATIHFTRESSAGNSLDECVNAAGSELFDGGLRLVFEPQTDDVEYPTAL